MLLLTVQMLRQVQQQQCRRSLILACSGRQCSS